MRKYLTHCYLVLFSMLLFVPTGYAKVLGKIEFPISCTEKSQQQFNKALALVHHMMYIQAEKKFQTIIKNDPTCAMAYWGVALTQTQPLWGGKPSKAALKKGATALAKAKLLNPPTKREKAFIKALEPLYLHWQSVPYKKRLMAWEKAQYLLYKDYPNDADAVALYALSHLAVSPKDDKTFSHQKTAGKLLEKMNQENPSHPGGFHYLIHAYDNSLLAHKAEKVARGYSKIAPEVPHALHMPSHIFVRLGLWPETIAWNIRSARAAKQQYLKGGVMSMHFIHAMDYLMYAYLQQGRHKKAANVLKQVNAIGKYQDSFPTAYGIAALRARFYLEQHLWKQVANIPLRKPKNYPWDKYPAVESMSYFARGMGLVKTGELKNAEFVISQLKAIEKTLRNKERDYWATLVTSRQMSLSAWLAYAKGEVDKALKLMQRAADLEDSVDKHPVTPGEVLPAREMLGDLLMKLDKPARALVAYQGVLAISPNRLNSLYGAGLAAEAVGNVALAKSYYLQLLKQTKQADSRSPLILHAKAFLRQQDKK